MLSKRAKFRVVLATLLLRLLGYKKIEAYTMQLLVEHELDQL